MKDFSKMLEVTHKGPDGMEELKVKFEKLVVSDDGSHSRLFSFKLAGAKENDRISLNLRDCPLLATQFVAILGKIDMDFGIPVDDGDKRQCLSHIIKLNLDWCPFTVISDASGDDGFIRLEGINESGLVFRITRDTPNRGIGSKLYGELKW